MKQISRPQSRKSRQKVEQVIDELNGVANANPAVFKKPVTPGAYRTVWSTVTSDTLIGQLLGQKASVVLGGPSWQVISPDRSKSENIVYWPVLNLRMVGLASLSPLQQNYPKGTKSQGYELSIRGLEFRWGSEENNGLPEQLGLLGDQQNHQGRLEVIKLKDDEMFSNGRGELKVLYNDGLVRVVHDSTQDNSYVHVKEPVPSCLHQFI